MSDIKERLADLQARFKETIDTYHETVAYYDFVQNNDPAYVDGYLEAEADLSNRVYLSPGDKAPEGRQVFTTKRGRRFYKTTPRAAQRMPGNPFHSGGIDVPRGPGAKSKEVKEAGVAAVKHSTTGNAFDQEADKMNLAKKQAEERKDRNVKEATENPEEYMEDSKDSRKKITEKLSKYKSTKGNKTC